MLELLSKLVESISLRLGENLVQYALSKEETVTFQSLKRNIEVLRKIAMDVCQQIEMAELCSKKKRKRVVEDWLEQVLLTESKFHISENEIQTEGFLKRFFGKGQAEKLDSEVRKLIEQSQHFGELVLDAYGVIGVKFVTSGLMGEEFKNNLENIIRLLSDDKVPSIGIYGMGGVGKTTLVQHINNQLLERTHECIIWITVSAEFTITLLQDKIAKELGLNLSNECDEDKRSSKLRIVLSQIKNLILIFDDVWKKIDFMKLGDPLSLDGCRLVITTRSRKLCHEHDCKEVINVKTLKEDEAWNLFIETLGRNTNLIHEVQEIAKSMVGFCDGLPLGIITLAGSMKGLCDVHLWRNALEELKESTLGQDDMEEKVFKVLKYSFDRLDRSVRKNNCYSKLQLSFLQCSLYPEDCRIDRDDLIEKFIVEEFLHKRDSRKALFDQGQAILDHLVSVCLLERVDHNTVKMHDLVRAMALKITEVTTKVIAGNRAFTYIPNDEEWTEELEKMSLMMNGIRKINVDRMFPECLKLSTLLLNDNPLEFIRASFFSKVRKLHTLDLSSTSITRLPRQVSEMVNLRALILRRCTNLQYMPDIGQLKGLKKLDLTNTAIVDVPQGMEKLINLQFLGLFTNNLLEMLPSRLLLNFCYLQCLYLPFHILGEVEELVELNHLEEFCGRVKDSNAFFQLLRNRKIFDYCIVVQRLLRGTFFRGYNQLALQGYDLKKAKNEDVDVDLGILRHLELRECEGTIHSLLEDLGRLINPTSLETLTISNCHGIEFVLNNEQRLYSTVSTSTSPLLVQVVFTSLRELEILSCDNIKGLGISVSQLPNLEKISIVFCEQIEEIFEVIEENERRQSGHVQVVSLPKLFKIELNGLPKLKSICNATIVCGSLKWISMKGCKSLKKFPLVFGQPNCDSPPVASMSINIDKDEKEWWEKLELGHPTHHSLLQPFIRWC